MSDPPLSDLPGTYLYEYTGANLIRVAAAFIPIEIAFVALRYYSRYLIKAPTGVDDILALPSLISCLSVNCIALTMVKYAGVGRHLPALAVLNPIRIVRWAKLLLAVEWLYLLAATLPKLCILAIYLRIFTIKLYRRICYVLGAIIIANFIAGGLTGTFACQPIAYNWDKTIPGGHCIDIDGFFRWISLPNILTDVAMLVLPMPIVWGLHATRNQKIGLTITFLTGSVGLISSIIRFANFLGHNALADGTFASVDLMTWTLVEPGTYLIASCLPALRPLVQHVIQGTPLSTLGGSHRSRKYGAAPAEPGSRNIAPRRLKDLESSASHFGTSRSMETAQGSFAECSTTGDERSLVATHKLETGTADSFDGPDPQMAESTSQNQIRVMQDYRVTITGKE